MSIQFKVGGSWRTLTGIWIKVGGVWKEPDAVSIKQSGGWYGVWNGFVSVIVAATKSISDAPISGNGYTWVGVNADGDLYSSTTGTTPNVSYETWLDNGLNSDVWVEATLGGLGPDALTTGSDATGSRLACSTTRKWGYTATPGNGLAGVVTLDFYDAATGGSLLDSQAVTLDCDATGST